MVGSESVPPTFSPPVCQVYEHNFEKELRRLWYYAQFYPVISIDTEFPGFVHGERAVSKVPGAFRSFELMARNVKELKLIQLGISISDMQGDSIVDGGTWQFNFRFDIDRDKHDGRRRRSGTQTLKRAGLEFRRLRDNGIPHDLFFKTLKTSGLLQNPTLRWVSYHGLYDFGYMVKYLNEKKGLQNARVFQESLQAYFPKRCDIKVLALGHENLPTHGGLQNLADHTKCERIGTKNHAGSDSALTRDVFVKLVQGTGLRQKLASQNGLLFGTPRYYYSHVKKRRVAN